MYATPHPAFFLLCVSVTARREQQRQTVQFQSRLQQLGRAGIRQPVHPFILRVQSKQRAEDLLVMKDPVVLPLSCSPAQALPLLLLSPLPLCLLLSQPCSTICGRACYQPASTLPLLSPLSLTLFSCKRLHPAEHGYFLLQRERERDSERKMETGIGKVERVMSATYEASQLLFYIFKSSGDRKRQRDWG